MDASNVSFGQVATTAKDLARLLLNIGENRFELLTLEVQEERERLQRALFLALGVAVFGLLAGLTLTAGMMVVLWPYSPVGALLTLTGIYGAAGVYFGRRLAGELRDGQTLSTSLDQLRKDRACLEKIIA